MALTKEEEAKELAGYQKRYEEGYKTPSNDVVGDEIYGRSMKEKGRPPTYKEMEDARAGYNATQALKYIFTGPIGLGMDLLGLNKGAGGQNRELVSIGKGGGRDWGNAMQEVDRVAGPALSPNSATIQLMEKSKPAFTSRLDPRFADLQFLAAEQARGRAAPTMNQAPQLQQRENQIQLLRQLEQSRGQDTIAKLQGQKALGESAYRGAQQQAMGGGLAEATEATRQSQNVVSQVGEGAVAQDYATRNMQNLLSTQGRGQDFQVTKAQNGLQIAQQESNNAMIKFYQTLGDDFETAQRRAATEQEKLRNAAQARFQGMQDKTVNDILGVVGTMFGMKG